MKNSAEFNIELNAKNNSGNTAFHLACLQGNVKIVDMLMKNSAEFNIELNAKDDDSCTAHEKLC